MSARQAKRAFEAAHDFNVGAHTGDDFIMARIGRVLATRLLGDKHFAEMQDHFARLEKATLIKIDGSSSYNPETVLQRRVLKYSSLHIGFGNNDAGQSTTNRYIPLCLEAEIRQNLVDYRVRPLPITFISDHTEDRFGYRKWLDGERDIKRQQIDYGSKEFKNAIALALTLTHPLERLMGERRQPSVPIAVPYAGGLFLGNITLYPVPANLFHKPALLAYRDEAAKKFTSAGLHGESIPPYWQPTSVITLKTYVLRMRPALQALAAELDAVTGTYKGQKGLDAALSAYVTVPVPQDTVKITPLFDLQRDLAKLVRSPVWDKAHAGSWDHIDPNAPKFRQA